MYKLTEPKKPSDELTIKDFISIGMYTKEEFNSLLQEIEEKVIGEDESPKLGHRSMQVEFVSTRNWVRQQQRKALKTIKERYGI